MKAFISILFCACFMVISSFAYAQQVAEAASPDGQLQLNVHIENGKPVYTVSYKGKPMLENSPLGLTTNEGDFSSDMSFVESVTGVVDKKYFQDRIKQSNITYNANTLKCTFSNADGKQKSFP